MFMKLHKLWLVFGVAALTAGCAGTPQLPVALSSGSLGSQGGKVGVVMTAPPKPDLHLPGASCLLCLAVATAANSSLNSHSQALPVDDVVSLKRDAAETLRAKGTEVVVLPDDLKLDDLPSSKGSGANLADRDYAALKQKYQIDKLLVIDIQRLGVERNYASYIPTSEPRAIVRGRGFIVNLSNSTYEWYQPVNVVKAGDGKWDEPPKFPGLSNAYFQAIETARDDLLKPLGR